VGSRLGRWLGRLERIKKAGGPDLAHGSWFAAGAVLPPGNYLEEGTDLPRSATPTGAIEGTKRSVMLIILAASVRWLTGTEPVPVAECRRAPRRVSTVSA
jgi:hypothetical protein